MYPCITLGMTVASCDRDMLSFCYPGALILFVDWRVSFTWFVRGGFELKKVKKQHDVAKLYFILVS